MRVVDDGEAAARFADDLEPPFDALQSLQRRQDAAGDIAGGNGKTGGDERVRGLVFAEQRQTDVEHASLVRDRHALRKAFAHQPFELQAFAGTPDGEDAAPAALRRRRRARALRAVGVDDDGGAVRGGSSSENRRSLAARYSSTVG